MNRRSISGRVWSNSDYTLRICGNRSDDNKFSMTRKAVQGFRKTEVKRNYECIWFSIGKVH